MQELDSCADQPAAGQYRGILNLLLADSREGYTRALIKEPGFCTPGSFVIKGDKGEEYELFTKGICKAI